MDLSTSQLLGVQEEDNDFSDDGLANLSGAESADENENGEHERLLDAIATLSGKKRIKPPVRSEPSVQMSEFHLSAVEGIGGEEEESNTIKGGVKLSELARALGKKTAHTGLKKQLKAVTRHAKTLPKPLLKPEAEKIERTTAFDKAKKEVSRWNGVVYSRREAEQLSFPLNSTDVHVETTQTFLSDMTPKTPLEIELAKVLGGLDQPKPEKVEKTTTPVFSLAEAIEQRKEMAKMRARHSYMEIKMRRQSKIKSKNYHRILKRQKLKMQMTEFEQLQKSDPEAALEKLEQMEVVRAQERASLRHRNTSKWARNQAVRAKYNRDSRQMLSEQLKISRDLTQKIKPVESSDEEGAQETTQEMPDNMIVTEADRNNPWISGSLIDKSVKEFVTSFQRFQEEKENADDDSNAIKSVDKLGEYLPLSSERPQKTNVLEIKNQIAHDLPDSQNDIDGQQQVHKKTPTNKKSTNDQIKINKKIKKKQKHDKNICEEKPLQNGTELLKQNKRKKDDVEEDKMKNKRKKKENGKESNKNVANKLQIKDLKRSAKKNKKALQSLNIDDMFDEYEESKRKEVSHKLAQHRAIDDKDEDMEVKTEKNEESDTFKDVVLPLRTERSLKDDMFHDELESRDEPTEININTRKASAEPQIDPTKFVKPVNSKIKTINLESEAPKLLDDADEDAQDDISDGEENSTRMAIAEAFADDDVVAEFREEKARVVDSSKPKDVDLFLPGWGAWGGFGINPSEKRRKRFLIKAPPAPPRRDENKGDVIINEDKNVKIREHLVSEVPYPFKKVADFEASIRAPVGRTWMPETAHKKMILPKVVSKSGAIIEPMGEEALANRPQRKRVMRFKNNKKKDGIDAPAKIDV